MELKGREPLHQPAGTLAEIPPPGVSVGKAFLVRFRVSFPYSQRMLTLERMCLIIGQEYGSYRGQLGEVRGAVAIVTTWARSGGNHRGSAATQAGSSHRGFVAT